MKPFLRQVARELLRRSSHGVDGEVLVLPSKRAARFIQRYLGLEAGSWLWSPRVMTMDEFIHQSHPETLADPISTYFELYDVYASELGADASSFASFIKWGRTLLGDLDEVDRYMIPPERIFSDLRKIKEIEEWSFDREELSYYQDRYLKLWMKLGGIHRGLKESLASKGRVLKGELYRRLGEEPSLAEGWASHGKVHFIGLNALSSAEEQLVSHLVREGKAEVHFDADPYYMDDLAQEAGYFLRRYRKSSWGKGGFGYGTGPMKGKGRKVNMIGVNGRVSQAKVAGRILEREGDPTEEELRSALVLADEGLLHPVLHSLPSSLGPVNVTMGFPLSQTSVHAFFRDLLRMYRQYQRYREEGGAAVFYYKDLFRVLEHPYMDAVFQERLGISSKKPVERIRSSDRSFLDREEILEFLRSSKEGKEEVPELFKELFEPFRDRDHILSFQEKILEAFREAMKERGGALDSENFFEYGRVLRRIRELFDEGHRVNEIEAYERILFQVVEGEELSFTGEPLQGVQVMGMLETRAIDLSHIILLSANESYLPGSGVEASLIPQDLRSHYKMPTRHEKDSVFAYHFYRMIQRADRVDLIYDSDPDGAGSGEKSRYLTQLLQEGARKDPQMKLEEHSVHIPLKKRKSGPLSIPKDESVIARMRQWASSGISPTALSTWIEDPYAFYRKYVLGLPEPDELAESIDARSLGELIHHSLYDLYRTYQGKQLPAKSIGEMLGEVEGVVRARFEEHYHPKGIEGGKNLIMLRVVQDRVKRFLRNEKALVEAEEARGGGLFIESLETPFSTELELQLPEGAFPVRLVGTADRIDRIGGEVRLIDLKTGMVTPGKLKVGTMEELFDSPGHKYALQLLFYGSIYSREHEHIDPEAISPSVIGFRALGKGPMGLGRKKGCPYGSMNEMLEAFETSLKEELTGMLDPEKAIAEREEGVFP